VLRRTREDQETSLLRSPFLSPAGPGSGESAHDSWPVSRHVRHGRMEAPCGFVSKSQEGDGNHRIQLDNWAERTLRMGFK